MKKLSFLLVLLLIFDYLLQPVLASGETYYNPLSNEFLESQIADLMKNSTVSDNTYQQVDDNGNDTVNQNLSKKYIVKFAEGLENGNNGLFQTNGSQMNLGDSEPEVIKEFSNFSYVVMELTDEEYQVYKDSDNVVYIEPDHIATVAEATYTEPPTELTTLGYSTIGASQLHSRGIFGDGIKIAVIDTGVDIHHEDLLIAGGASFVSQSYEDDNGHGTRVTGVISSQLNGIGIKGIAPSSNVYALKAFNSQGTGYYSQIIAAIDWSIDNDMDIINMSFEGDANSLALQEAVKRAWDSGILVIASSGNGGSPNLSFPAQYPSVVAVGSIDENLEATSFSNYGSNLALVAPGSKIYSTDRNNNYISVSGSSFSAAYVSGAAAEVWSAHRDWSAEQVRIALLRTSIPLGNQERFGYGLVNPVQAVDEQYLREVSINPDGTVTGAVYGDFSALVSFLNKTPADYTEIVAGSSITTSLQLEDAIRSVFIKVLDENLNELFVEERKNKNFNGGIGYDLSLGDTVSFTWNTTPSTPLGNYTIKYGFCFYDPTKPPGYQIGCWTNTSWTVKVKQAGISDTQPPSVSFGDIGNQLVQNVSANIPVSASDNMSLMSISLKAKEVATNNVTIIGTKSVSGSQINTNFSWTPQNVGDYILTLTATDTSNNSNTASIPVTVIKDDDPIIESIYVTVDNNQSPEEFRDIIVRVIAKDNKEVKKLRLQVKYGGTGSLASINFNSISPQTLQEINTSGSLVDRSFNSWAPMISGWYQFSVTAFDNLNQQSIEKLYTFWANSDVTKPVVSSINLSTPDNLPYEEDKIIKISSSATDNGYVKKLKFIVNHLQKVGNQWVETVDQEVGTFANPQNTHSFSATVNWIPSTYGYYKVKVIAEDQNHNSTTFTDGNMYWVNQEKIPPTVSISIDRSQKLISGHRIPISFSANDKSGINKIIVNIYQATSNANLQNKIYSSTLKLNLTNESNPFPWKPTTEGWYRLTIVATDNAGNLNNEYDSSAYTDLYVEKAKNVIIYVPGFLGTEINKLGQRIWPTIYPELATYLGLSETGMAGNSTIGDVFESYSVLGNTVEDTTQVFLNSLRNSDIKVIKVPYDWRVDLTEAVEKIGNAVSQALVESGGQDITIITHSTGGLPARKYLIDHPEAKVKNFIAIAAPFLGTPRSMQGLEVGDDLNVSYHGIFPINNALGKQIVQNMTSVYELLPGQRFVDVYNSFYKGTLFDYKTFFSDYTDATKYNLGHFITNYPQTSEYIDIKHNSSLYQIAKSFRNDIETGAISSKVKEYRFVAFGFQTIMKIDKADQYINPKIPGLGTRPDYKLYWGSGDEVVPLRSADFNQKGNASIYYFKNSHMGILKNATVQNEIKNIILFDSPPNPSSYPSFIEDRKGWGVMVNCPVNVNVFDTNGNSASVNSDGVLANNIPGLSYEIIGESKGLFVPEGLNVHFEIEGYDGGYMNLAFTKYTGDLPGNSNVIHELKVMNNTEINFDFDGSFTNVSNLDISYDLLGNGQTNTIHPTLELTLPEYSDAIPPQSTVTLNGVKHDDWFQSDVTVSLSASDSDGSGVTHIYYQIDDNQLQEYSQPLIINGEGQFNIKYYAVDKAGNYEMYHSIDIKIDKTAPTEPSIIPHTSNDWVNNDFTFSIISGTDNGSGVQKNQYRINTTGIWTDYSSDVSIDLEGITTFYARTIDYAGNISNEVSETVKIDKSSPSAPTITSTADGWTNSNVTLTITDGADAFSGVKKNQYKIGVDNEWEDYHSPLTINAEGQTQVLARSIDYANNISEVSEHTVKIDKSAPSLPTITLSNSNWSNTDVTFTIIDGEDGLSGVNKSQYKIGSSGGWKDYTSTVTVALEGETYIYARTIDNVSNISNNAMALVKIDKTIPQSPILVPSKTKWSNEDISFTMISGVDHGSGIEKNQYKIGNDGVWKDYKDIAVVISEEGITNIYARSIDKAGNISKEVSFEAKIDKTPPQKPTNLYSNGKTSREIYLYWEDNSEKLGSPVSYEVYNNNILVGNTTSTSFLVKNLKPLSLNILKIRAVDEAGNYSNFVNEIKIMTYLKISPGSFDSYWNSTDVHALAILNGTVWSWGANRFGQLGDGSTVERTSPARIINTSDFVDVSSRGQNSLALKNDGTVWTWGLGIMQYYQAKTPIQIQNLSGIIQIANGISHNLALQNNGSVWSWGYDHRGQLGDAPRELDPDPNPKKINSLNNVIQVSVGDCYSLALKNNGTVWSWGCNENFELGDGQTDGNYYRRQPEQVVNLNAIISISSGSNHNLALKSDGTIWSWGSGGLGDGELVKKPTPTKVQVPGVFKAVSASGDCSMALKEDGTVWIWGDCLTQQFQTPVQVPNLNSVIDIAAGPSHLFVIKEDGTLWSWGYNKNGILGNGTLSTSEVPVLVKLKIKPSVVLSEPLGTLDSPQITGTTTPAIEWTQYLSDIDSSFGGYQIKVLNESGDGLIYDSGQIYNETSNINMSVNISESLPANQKLQIVVRIYDDSQWSDWSKATWVIIDTDPPSVPANLTAIGNTSTSVGINWEPSTDNIGVKEYEIYKDGILVGTSSSNSYIVSGLEVGKSYKLSVKAKDFGNNFSLMSTPFMVLQDVKTVFYNF